MKPEDAAEIINEQIIKGRPVTRLLYDDKITAMDDPHNIGFYNKQMRVVLRNCGVINPENIDEYIARHGYEAL